MLRVDWGNWDTVVSGTHFILCVPDPASQENNYCRSTFIFLFEINVSIILRYTKACTAGIFNLKVLNSRISNDITVIQWITSCHKNGMATRVITLWHVDITS